MRRLIVVAGLLTVVASQAMAQGRGMGRGGRGDGPPEGRGGPGDERAMACRVGADSLTDAQKQQVHALAQQFEAAHKGTLDSLKAINDAGRAAREAGKPREEMRATMELGRALQESLRPAHEQWRESLKSVLTSAQLEKGCIPPAPGSPPPGGRRGGGPPDRDDR